MRVTSCPRSTSSCAQERPAMPPPATLTCFGRRVAAATFETARPATRTAPLFSRSRRLNQEAAHEDRGASGSVWFEGAVMKGSLFRFPFPQNGGRSASEIRILVELVVV